MKRALLSGACLLTISVAAAATATRTHVRTVGATGHATYVTPRCTGSQLKLTEGEGDADMGGKRYGNYTFENVSKHRCSLRGFPKFTAVDRRGRVRSTMKVSYSNDYPGGQDATTKPMTIGPGEKASFQIFYNDGMALDHKGSYPNVSKVRISAPHGSKVFTLKGGFAPCCGIKVGSMRSGAPSQQASSDRKDVICFQYGSVLHPDWK